MLGLGLDQSHSHRLRTRVGPDAQRVVDPTACPLARRAADELDRAGGLLALDQILGPATRVEGWIDEFGAGVGF